jgi:molybdate transport system substrate-binding protein
MSAVPATRRRVLLLVVALLAAPGCGRALGQDALTIAAASDLQTVFPELASRFERDTGIRITVAFGSSGSFFAQVQNGAPFDVFFSADIDYPRRLGASGHADAATLFEYATGRIVLWTRKDSGIDVTRGLSVLQDTRVRRIAIANPNVAPYGRAAVAALRNAKTYDAVQGKIVLGENIAQTAQLADSGNADVAILAHSLALGRALSASGVSFDIPSSAHPPIEQAAIVVAASTHKEAARRFLTYLRGPDAQAILRRFGFGPAMGRSR